MTNTVSMSTIDGAIALGIDPKVFRGGMARLAAAVNVITTVRRGERFGFTASAVCSVTDTPATLLVCINRTARSHPIIAETGILCVNTLSATQEFVGMAFAGSNATMEERFSVADWDELETGAPVLCGASVSFDCKVNSIKQVGTHDVLFCDVVAIRCGEGTQGLVYFDRRFHALC